MNQSTYSEFLDSAFKFSIGDLVFSRAVVAAYMAEIEINAGKKADAYSRLMRERLGAPAPDVVVERILQQCHGGTQAFCVLRRWDTKNGTELLVKMTQDELVSYRTAIDALKKVADDRNAAADRGDDK